MGMFVSTLAVLSGCPCQVTCQTWQQSTSSKDNSNFSHKLCTNKTGLPISASLFGASLLLRCPRNCHLVLPSGVAVQTFCNIGLAPAGGGGGPCYCSANFLGTQGTGPLCATWPNGRRCAEHMSFSEIRVSQTEFAGTFPMHPHTHPPPDKTNEGHLLVNSKDPLSPN